MMASGDQILLVEPACGYPVSAMLGEALSGARLIVARGSADALLLMDGPASSATAVLLGVGSGPSIVDAAEVVEQLRGGSTSVDRAAAVVAIGCRKSVRALRDAMGDLVDRYMALPMASAALLRALRLALDRDRVAALRAERRRAACPLSSSAPWSSGT